MTRRPRGVDDPLLPASATPISSEAAGASDQRALGAERQRGGEPAAVGDPTRRDDRRVAGEVHDLGTITSVPTHRRVRRPRRPGRRSTSAPAASAPRPGRGRSPAGSRGCRASWARATSSGRRRCGRRSPPAGEAQRRRERVLVERPDRVVDRERRSVRSRSRRHSASSSAPRAPPSQRAEPARRHTRRPARPGPRARRGREDGTRSEQIAQRRAQHAQIIVGPAHAASLRRAARRRRRAGPRRPPLNLFGPAVLDDLEAAIAEVQEASPRALIFRAQGDVVSAGVDVHVFDGLDSAGADALTRRACCAHAPLEDLPLPTLAVAHGLCLTAALELSSRVTCCGRRGCAVRARGGGGWHHTADGRHAADRRARGQRARASSP